MRTPEKAKIDVTGASQALVEIGYSPLNPRAEKRIEHHRHGALGAHHGLRGAEFGRLGGRPKKVENSGLAACSAGAALSRGNRKKQCVKRVKDESFGIVARLQVCKLVEELREALSNHELDLEDIYTFLHDKTGRPKDKIKWAFENKARWIEEKARLQLGEGSTSANARGMNRKLSNPFLTSMGLRAQGGGAKPIFQCLHEPMKKWFWGERSNGRYIDMEELVVEFEALLLALCGHLEAKAETAVGLTRLEVRQLAELKVKLPKLSKTETTRRYWALRLKAVVGARLLKPQRMLTLSLKEEERRVIETWKDWDHKMHQICF